jgi:hypothetical protein
MKDLSFLEDELNFARKNKQAIARRLTAPAIFVSESNPVSVFMAGENERNGRRIDLFGCGLQGAVNNLTHDFDERVAVLETKSIRLRERIAHRFECAA